jgi:ABC-type Fe3+ transport system permease subunit
LLILVFVLVACRGVVEDKARRSVAVQGDEGPPSSFDLADDGTLAMAAAVAVVVVVLVVAILLVVRKWISRKTAIHDGAEAAGPQAADAWKVPFSPLVGRRG